MKRHLYLCAIAALLAAPIALHADEAANPENRLKEALKNTMVQLRTVSGQLSDAQAQVADLQAQNTDLGTKLKNITKAASDAQTADTKTITMLKGQLSDQESSIASLQKSLDEWKKARTETVSVLQATEAKRAKLAELSIHLQRAVDDQRRKNSEMYKVAMDLLDRYEKYGLGQALTAKEPFVGITRAKFQTLVQDYQDKLTDQLITDTSTPSANSSPSTEKPKQ